MNVAEIRRRVEREIRMEPATEEWRAEFLDRLNDKLDTLVTSRKWSFRQRLHNVRTYSGFTLQPADYTANGATSGTLGFEFAIPTDWELYDVLQGARGHTVTIAGATGTYLAQELMNREFVIEESGLAGAGMYIKLDPRYPGSALLTGNETLTFKFRRYKLPLDVSDVFACAGRGPDDDMILDEMSLAEESRRLLNDDDGPGTPTVWVADPNYPSPYEANQLIGQGYPNDFNPPPPNAPTLLASAGGALAVGSTYTYRYAWRYGGFWSESSPEASVTIVAPNQTVTITLDALGGSQYGRARTVFRRQDEGPWYRIAELADPSATTIADGGTFNPFADPTQTLRERTFHPGGLNRFIRFYPLSDKVRELELRYLSRPPLLETESDIPEIPGEFHQVFVHMIAMDMLANANQSKMAGHQENLMESLLDNMSRRYLTTGSVRIQREGVFRGRGYGLRASRPRFVGDG